MSTMKLIFLLSFSVIEFHIIDNFLTAEKKKRGKPSPNEQLS